MADIGISMAVGVAALLYGFRVIGPRSPGDRNYQRFGKWARWLGALIVITSVIRFAWRASGASQALAIHAPLTLDQPGLEAVAAQVKQQLPIKADSETQLDDVTTGDHELIYHMTLVNKLAAEIDRAAFAQAMERQLKSAACRNIGYTKLMAAGISISTIYQSKDGAELGRITLPPSFCGGEAPGP